MAKKFVGQAYLAATNGKGLEQQTKGNRILSRTTMACSTIITVVSVFIVAFCLFFQMCPVIGTSMMKTLNASGANTNNALTCTVGEPSHGDIVVMKLYIENMHCADYPAAAQGDANALSRLGCSQQQAVLTYKTLKTEYDATDAHGNYKLIVKRLIGKGGDQISMRRIGSNYYIYVNGIMLDESYLDEWEVGSHDALNFTRFWEILNHPTTVDMKDWVTIDYHDLLTPNADTAADGNGTPSTYMLTIPADYYFVMGDNRGGNVGKYNYSWDSTYFGPLPTTNYYSYCVDILDNDTSMPAYLWEKFVYYVCFGWVWQK